MRPSVRVFAHIVNSNVIFNYIINSNVNDNFNFKVRVSVPVRRDLYLAHVPF